MRAMGLLTFALNVTLDGCVDHRKGIADDELHDYFAELMDAAGAMLFGRTTYEMMASAWPSDEAHDDQPGMADVMGKSPKIVFSKSLRDVEEGPRWQNVEIRRDIDAAALRDDDRDYTTLGSGSIVQQLTNLGLVDEYTFVVNPVLLGRGKNAFVGIDAADLDLSEAHSFKNGLVWLSYHRR